MLDFVDAPCKVIVLKLLGGRVEDDVCAASVAYAPSFWVLACGVDGVDDGVGESKVTDAALFIH